ncbi:MAG: CocE/NonD family hydrolase [Thermoanaerobaculia bacterium]
MAADAYVSDPAKPVPYRQRPARPMWAADSTWSQWLVDDQRFASDRTDVLVYVSDVLTASLAVAGSPVANLFAATSGTDADWVVKLIDLRPDEVPTQPELGGYQLAVSMDILRGRYRESFETPSPIPADSIQRYRWTLPTVHHVFAPGHRIMVQIQSTWFPHYDRSPQTWVESIFFALPADYRPATHRVFRGGDAASFVELPVVASE